MSCNQLIFSVPEECDGMRARTFLRNYCGVSARIITLSKREKDGILRNDKILRTVDTVSCGDKITINLSDDINKIEPVKGDLSVLFEDDYIIVVDKPYNMPVHPTKVHQQNTLAYILKYIQDKKGESFTFRAVNRLDKDTSGIIIIAKNKYIAAALQNRVHKTYLAVCEGIISEQGTVDKPIKLLEGHTVQRTVSDEGKHAITHYTPISIKNNHTLLKIILETGRTHQIRCHMSSIGHPLAGDDMYGGSLHIINRQALHCDTVCFIHPVTQKETLIKSPLPNDIAKIIKEP